jgi:hypothetical protein
VPTPSQLERCHISLGDYPLKVGIHLLYRDRRLGNIERWCWGDPREADVRIHDSWKECVCFLGVQQGGGDYHYGGTAFFVSVPGERDKDFSFVYIVTAKHCIENAQKSASRLFLRLNREQKAEWVEERSAIDDTWILADYADVALAKFTPSEEFPIKCIPVGAFLTDAIVKSEDIGIGNNLYFPGLFRKRTGQDRNIPILRSGIIAAMPEESLQDDATGQPYQAYLAEVRSIGGLSGSPVFVLSETGTSMTLSKQIRPRYTCYLLGLIRGHWDINEFSHESEQINSGIALVTPIAEVHNLLFREDLVKDRRREEAKRVKDNAPILDSALLSHGDAEIFTKEAFEKALQKVSRRIEKPGSET